ncbi:hypothetical protein PF003_g37905 [Phytophthora fragariae]|nr:hypothetical protein PF003_g40127 [Phytophthora fragariae]KAE8878084.1 hypothetical protein PF003_g37905 [Phytophthora fragariae]
MGRGPSITDEEKGRIRGLHEAGWGVREIARSVKRSPDGVSYVLRATKKPPAKARRPKSLTDRQIRQIVRGSNWGLLGIGIEGEVWGGVLCTYNSEAAC